METGFAERLGCVRRHLRAVTLADALDVRALGFALNLAWVSIVFFSTTVHFSTRNDVSHFNSVFGFSSLGMLVVLLLAAFASRPFMRAMCAGVVRWVAPCAMTVATIVLVVVDLDIIRQPWCSIASIATGVGLGVLYVAWGTLYKGLTAEQAVVKTASSFVLAALLFALVVALPRSVGVVVTTLIPLVIGGLLFGVLRVWRELPQVMPRQVSRVAFSLRAVLSLGVLSFTESLMRALFFNATPIISEGSYPWLFLVAAIVSVGVVIGPLFTDNELDFGMAYKASVFVLAFVFLLLPILDLGTIPADLLALISYCVSSLLIWTVLVRVAGLYGLSALLAFGLGWGAHVAGVLAGTFGGALIGTYVELTPRLLSMVALACACLLFFAYLFLFTERFMNRLAGGERAGRRHRTGKRPFRERCEDVAEEFGLTPREAQIMALLAKGRSTPRICTELGLTSGTVNTHLAHLYRKLDIHDKQELIDLLDRPACASS